MQDATSRTDASAPRLARDTRGHGPSAPDPRWPGGARIAVQFAIAYAEGAAGPDGRRPRDPSSGYGARAGFWRLHRLFTALDVPVTVFGDAAALARSPAQVAAMQAAGWEIAGAGPGPGDGGAPEDAAAALRLHAEATGAPPPGWRAGRGRADALDAAEGEDGLEYRADGCADDLPYWRRGADGRARLVVPCEPGRRRRPGETGDRRRAQLVETFDALYAEGEAGAAKMMSVVLEPGLDGRPAEASALRRFLDHAARHEGVWIARRVDIARHWARVHPAPAPGDPPSRMPREAFVARFGGVFERSPWIAERAHALELGPAHDTAIGLGNALARVFRAAGEEERLGVLKAHPDLAGKLAAARRLTAESASEQAGAGLDALTDAERARFADLNARYTARFGFPFIIAVKGLDKGAILAAFERRIANDRDAEFAEACRQVERIAALRLAEMLPE